jgi:hypothetical protein
LSSERAPHPNLAEYDNFVRVKKMAPDGYAPCSLASATKNSRRAFAPALSAPCLDAYRCECDHIRERRDQVIRSQPEIGRHRPAVCSRGGARRSLARADPAGCGASTRIGRPVGRTPTVGHFQGDVFVQWCGLDRIPTIIVFDHPRCMPPLRFLVAIIHRARCAAISSITQSEVSVTFRERVRPNPMAA